MSEGLGRNAGAFCFEGFFEKPSIAGRLRIETEAN
jgi:hypothetical protein